MALKLVGTPKLSLPFHIKQFIGDISDFKNDLVDPNLKFWNTFFDVVIEWAPKLEQIYRDEQQLD